MDGSYQRRIALTTVFALTAVAGGVLLLVRIDGFAGRVLLAASFAVVLTVLELRRRHRKRMKARAHVVKGSSVHSYHTAEPSDFRVRRADPDVRPPQPQTLPAGATSAADAACFAFSEVVAEVNALADLLEAREVGGTEGAAMLRVVMGLIARRFRSRIATGGLVSSVVAGASGCLCRSRERGSRRASG